MLDANVYEANIGGYMCYIYIYTFLFYLYVPGAACTRAMGGRKRACALDAAGASAYRGFDVTCV